MKLKDFDRVRNKELDSYTVMPDCQFRGLLMSSLYVWFIIPLSTREVPITTIMAIDPNPKIPLRTALIPDNI